MGVANILWAVPAAIGCREFLKATFHRMGQRFFCFGLVSNCWISFHARCQSRAIFVSVRHLKEVPIKSKLGIHSLIPWLGFVVCLQVLKNPFSATFEIV